jgi:hypothetical protein
MERTFFLFGVLSSKYSDSVAGRKEFRHSSLCSEFRPRSLRLMLDLFCAVWDFRIFGMGGGEFCTFAIV